MDSEESKRVPDHHQVVIGASEKGQIPQPITAQDEYELHFQLKKEQLPSYHQLAPANNSQQQVNIRLKT